MKKNDATNARTKVIKAFLLSWAFWKPFLSILAGGTAGFTYYYFIGCSSGQCAITSSPLGSIILGGFLGFFVVNSPCSRGKC